MALSLWLRSSADRDRLYDVVTEGYVALADRAAQFCATHEAAIRHYGAAAAAPAVQALSGQPDWSSAARLDIEALASELGRACGDAAPEETTAMLAAMRQELREMLHQHEVLELTDRLFLLAHYGSAPNLAPAVDVAVMIKA